MEQLSNRELRKFGLSVGTAFVVLGLASAWRGHVWAPRVLWVLAALLVVPGAVAPALLGPVQRGWMRFAAGLGHVNSRIILGAFFYLFLTPLGMLLRLFRDPLKLRFDNQETSNWIRRPQQPVDPNRYRQQF